MTDAPTLDHPRTRAAYTTIRRLVAGYLAISVVALVAIVLMRHDATEVNDTVWTRGIIVVVTAVLLLAFIARASRGSRSAFVRLRVVSIVTPVAILVLVALPGVLPLWMRIEQGVCGLVMMGVAAIANGRHLRSAFPRP